MKDTVLNQFQEHEKAQEQLALRLNLWSQVMIATLIAEYEARMGVAEQEQGQAQSAHLT